jgi:membrane-associated protease RseP (regulator of RpoE activity)
MMAQTNAGNSTVRTIVVIGLSLLLLAVSAVGLREIWHPTGTFGYGTNVDGVVTGVSPGSPADRAGIRVGDQLDEVAMTPQQRWDLIQIPEVESPGTTETLSLYHSGIRRTVTIVSVAEPMTAANQTVIVLDVLAATLFIAIGAFIVLVRPEPATWGFFVFCAGYAPLALNEFNQIVRAPLVIYTNIAFSALQDAGLAGLIFFSLRFLQESVTGWRRRIRLAPLVVFAGLSASAAAETLTTYMVGKPAEWIAHVNVAFLSAGILIVVVALLDTYVHRPGAERQRMRWVVFGFGIAMLSQLAVIIIQTEATNTPFVVTDTLGLLGCVAPLSVAYAVVKHRVIDVNFVMSRTLVYAVLTTIFVAVFAFIDWFVGRVLDQTRWALVAEIAVAIGVGFWLNGLHARVDRFVDSVLFRRRHAAEHRLTRLARGLPHATSIDLIDASLIAEPSDALDLTSAALFRRDATGRYRRVSAIDWPPHVALELATDDPLILHLQAERGAMRLSEIHWSRDDAPSGTGRPSLALPITVRHELDAIVLFGAHRGGEDFDPDELQWLNTLSAAAGAAYDHLEADALRQKLEQLRHENESQRLALERSGLLAT